MKNWSLLRASEAAAKSAFAMNAKTFHAAASISGAEVAAQEADAAISTSRVVELKQI
jgi:hypothetical protein